MKIIYNLEEREITPNTSIKEAFKKEIEENKNNNLEQMSQVFNKIINKIKIKEEKNEKLEREKKMQKAMLDIKKKYGKNAILKGMNLQEDGTAMERNRQIGGHKA